MSVPAHTLKHRSCPIGFVGREVTCLRPPGDAVSTLTALGMHRECSEDPMDLECPEIPLCPWDCPKEPCYHRNAQECTQDSSAVPGMSSGMGSEDAQGCSEISTTLEEHGEDLRAPMAPGTLPISGMPKDILCPSLPWGHLAASSGHPLPQEPPLPKGHPRMPHEPGCPRYVRSSHPPAAAPATPGALCCPRSLLVVAVGHRLGLHLLQLLRRGPLAGLVQAGLRHAGPHRWAPAVPGRPHGGALRRQAAAR